MNAWLTYLFWPNPGNAGYDTPKVIALIVLSMLLIVGSFAIARWRNSLTNQSLKKVSRSWSTASVWFGLTGLVLTVSRVEQIQFLSMRALWGVWLVIAILYFTLQVRTVRMRTYEVLPSVKSSDPRAKYLPKRKRR